MPAVSKELDEDTGLYYYGARYLDPKYSRWLSGDPALNDYIPKAPIDDEAKKHNENLPGMGGVFNVVNLHVYHYAGNNPIKYTDPTGESIAGTILGWGCILGAGMVVIAGAVSTATGQIYITPGAATLAKTLFLTGTAILALDSANDMASTNSQNASSVLKNTLSVSASSSNPMPPDDDKDDYESNPKHHQNSKSPEPKNAKDMFDKSIKDPKKSNTRWYKDKNGTLHRFQEHQKGKYHWNGSFEGKPEKMPGYIDKTIRTMPKGDI